jgi:carbon-monoxide dehydrogenase medium subunit
MIPAAFEYRRPETLEEALGILAEHGEDAKLLAGGHSLLPAMKLRLAEPRILVDLRRVGELRFIRDVEGGFSIGAMATHDAIASSALLQEGCPLLGETARAIGDPQVRGWGTLGGSLAHADPAADWPAAMLALDAVMVLAGPGGRREVPATEFFLGLFETALQPGEALVEVRVPATDASVAYVKTRQKASGFALCGVAAVLDGGAARVAVTGVAAGPYRALEVERALAEAGPAPEALGPASRRAAEGVEPLSDHHASGEYRAHLACLNTRRALERALERASGRRASA